MEDYIMPIIVGIVIGLTIGYVIAKFLEKTKATKILRNTKKQASSMVKEARVEAEAIKKDKILQAKEKFIELKSEHEKVILSRDKKWQMQRKEPEIRSLRYLRSLIEEKN